MRSILVTGAAGAVGGRVMNLLIQSPDVERIVAVDRVPISDWHTGEESEMTIESIESDLHDVDLEPIIDGIDIIIHLAEDQSRDTNVGTARLVLERLLEAASGGAVSQFVLLSSALVYGAHGDNPVPITEGQPLRPSNLAHAQLKADLEALVTTWARTTNVRLTVLRPVVALSEGDGSWIGTALRAAMAIRPEQVDPPVQFLHHDDLARAVVHVVDRGLEGVYNVASDGWIGADAFRALRGETEVRLPERAGRFRHRVAMAFADRSLLEGLQPYVTHPWVVATDKLRATGWAAEYTSEEVYILGTSAPLLNSLGPQKRQELALGVAGAVGAAAVGAAVWAARRLTR